MKVLQNRQFSTDPEKNIDEARLQTLVYSCIKFESSSSTPSYQTRVDKVPYIKRDRRTEGQTVRRTDGRTDRPTDGRTSSTLYPLVFTGDNQGRLPSRLLSNFNIQHNNEYCKQTSSDV